MTPPAGRRERRSDEGGGIALVVPTCREREILEFLETWKTPLQEAAVVTYVVEDQSVAALRDSDRRVPRASPLVLVGCPAGPARLHSRRVTALPADWILEGVPGGARGDRYPGRRCAQLLAHYRNLGIRHYHLVLHSAEVEESALDRAMRLIAGGCAGLHLDVQTWVTADFQSKAYKEKLDELIRELDDEDWVLTVEADEFQVYPRGLQAMLDECAEGDFDCIHGVFVERLPAGRRLEALRVDAPLWEQCPVALGNRPALGNANKVVLHHKRITLVPGNHRVEHGIPRPHPHTVEVHHFRWFDNIYRKLDSNRSHPWWASEREERLRFIREHLSGERECRNI